MLTVHLEGWVGHRVRLVCNENDICGGYRIEQLPSLY